MELRKAAVAARNKNKADAIQTSPTDARATARAAARTLASLTGGPVGVAESDDDLCSPRSPTPTAMPPPINAQVAATPPSTKGNGKRPAAAGLALAGTAKVGRWTPAPPSALVATEAVAGSAAGASAGTTIAPRPTVCSGPSNLVGAPAPGRPAGPSGDPSLAADGSSPVAATLGLSVVPQRVSLRPVRGTARRVTTTTAPTLRAQAGRGPDRPVALGVRRRTHKVPALRVIELLTGSDKAEDRRAAVLGARASLPIFTPEVPLGSTGRATTPSPTGGGGGLASLRPSPTPPSPDVGGNQSAATPSDSARGDLGDSAPRPTAAIVEGAAMQPPVLPMIGITTGGAATAPAAGAAGSRAGTGPATRAYPDPAGGDVQFPMTSSAQATVDPLAAALGPGARGERRAHILERAVFGATRSVRIDVSAMEATVSETKDSLVGLKTKLDASMQLSQQTLGRLSAVEKTALDSVKSAVALGKLGSAGVDDDESAKKENLLKLVTVSLQCLHCVRE